jgi:Uma2 family endonuclease
MAALPELAFESTRTLSQEEFAAWVAARWRGDLNHYELLDGRVVMTPPAGYPHGAIEAALGGILEPFVRKRTLGKCFGSSQGFEVPSGDTVEPDYSFVSAERWHAMPPPEEGRFLRVVPDLVVEILARSTAALDRGEKKDVYERSGVREYWPIDPRARALLVYTRQGDRFDTGRTFAEGQPFSSAVLPGLAFDVASVL